jgi:hypothetical protein
MRTKSISISLVSSFLMATLSQPIQAKDNQCLGKICMGMGESQVRAQLGKPLNFNRRHCGRATLEYAQGGVFLQDGTTRGIEAKSSRWRTEKGIKVGDNISKAQKSYRLKKDDSSSFSTELSTGENLTFYIDRYQKIKRIHLSQVSVC